MPRYVVKTLGCKANWSDGQVIESELQRRGWRPLEEGTPESEADLCIVNSCTVTDEADRQSRRLATRLSRGQAASGRATSVVMTGCGAEVAPSKMRETPGVRWVVGNQDKHRLVDLVLGDLEQKGEVAPPAVLGSVSDYDSFLSRHPEDREWPASDRSLLVAADLTTASDTRRTRAFLKVQEGCSSFCTYCVIPYGRGPSRSLSVEEVVRQVQALVVQGFQEVILTATNLGDYGSDWAGSPQLEFLCRRLLAETALPRLRVSSLDPSEITAGLQELVQTESRFCPHFHVSLQSPHSRILKWMKRQYDGARVEECLRALSALRSPSGDPVYVGMDVITGFPGETDEIFEESVQILEALPWSRLHVFPYSEREGTPATRLSGKVPSPVRAARAKRLRELSLKRLEALHHEKLRLLQAAGGFSGFGDLLLESPVHLPGDSSRRWISGWTKDYWRVLVPLAPDSKPETLRNRRVEVMPTAVSVDRSAGEVCFLAQREL